MSPKHRASLAEKIYTMTLVVAIVFFGFAEALRWVGTWVALAGIAGSLGLLIVSAVIANRRDRKPR
jgi:hypothetical protein